VAQWVTGLMAVVLATSSAVAAPVAARRAKPAAKVAPKPVVVLAADVTIEPVADQPIVPRPAKPQAEGVLVVEYQRVGRELMKLQELRGTATTLDLWPTFRAIKLAELCKTGEGRIELEVVLKELRGRIERKRGIELTAECLNNPLAATCQ